MHWQSFLLHSLSKTFCCTRSSLKSPITLQDYAFKKGFSGEVPPEGVQRQFHSKQFSNCEADIKEKTNFALLVVVVTRIQSICFQY